VLRASSRGEVGSLPGWSSRGEVGSTGVLLVCPVVSLVGSGGELSAGQDKVGIPSLSIAAKTASCSAS
jgi:hypothetical protein